MNLESAVKFFAPKTPALSDAPGATGERLAISDVMASFGLTEAQARFGFELFLSKHGITTSDRAVSMLTDYGMGQAARYRAIASLSESVRNSLIQLLATFAYQDYTRSAASARPCCCCSGTGFIDAEVFTNKTYYPDGKPPIWARSTKGVFPSYWEETRSKREIVRVRCGTCNGKGEISNACRCHGKGTVIDKEQSELQGVPVTKECPKCSGRGYARLPGEAVRRAICLSVMQLSEPTWRRNFKPFYENLVVQCHKEESRADSMLSRVTR